mmetsp:Transcript_15645/g.28468  ORF Transcript_15645/g.28468 Transcript_15645/m.28468 type:complete len:96 (+) Transcript_15645:2558-2845(+)
MSKSKVSLGACALQMAHYLSELSKMREASTSQLESAVTHKRSLEDELIQLKARLDIVNCKLHSAELEQKRIDAAEVTRRLEEAAKIFESVKIGTK